MGTTQVRQRAQAPRPWRGQRDSTAIAEETYNRAKAGGAAITAPAGQSDGATSGAPPATASASPPCNAGHGSESPAARAAVHHLDAPGHGALSD